MCLWMVAMGDRQTPVLKVRVWLLLTLTYLARRYPRFRKLWVSLADRFVFVGEDRCRTN